MTQTTRAEPASRKVRRITRNRELAGAATYSAESVLGGRIPLALPMGVDGFGWHLMPFRDTHAAVFGRTGSGKSFSVLLLSVVLLALSAVKPVILAIDAKGTLYARTAPILRKLGYEVLHVDTREPEGSDSWNPIRQAWLHYRSGERERAEGELQRIAESLKDGSETKDPYWTTKAAETIVTLCVAMMELEPGREPTLGQAASHFAKGKDHLFAMARRLEGTRAGEKFASSLAIATSEKTFECIQDTAKLMLDFYSTQRGEALAGSSSFSVNEVLTSRAPVIVYITCADEGDGASKGFAALLFNEFNASHTEISETRKGDSKPLRVVWDETGSYPVCDLDTILPVARERDMLLLMTLQSAAQLEARGYDSAKVQVILSQVSTSYYFANSDPTIVAHASARTAGAIEPEDLVYQEVGEAVVVRDGRPAIAVKMPNFDDLVTTGDLSELAEDASVEVGHEGRRLENHAYDEKTGMVEREGLETSETADSNTQIEDLELSLKTYNALKRAGVHTLGILLERTADELCSGRRFLREESLAEVVSKLEGMGLSLKKDELGKGEPFGELKIECLDDLFADSDDGTDDGEAGFALDCLIDGFGDVIKLAGDVTDEVVAERVGDLIVTFEHTINTDCSREKASGFATAVCLGEYGRDWRLLKFYERCYDFILARGFADGMIEYYPAIMSVLDEMAQVIQRSTKLANREMGSPYPLKAVCDVSSALGRLVKSIDEQGAGRCEGLARLRKDAHECIDKRLKGTRLFLGSLCEGVEGLFKKSGSDNVAEWFAETGPDGLHMTILRVYESLSWAGIQSDLLDTALADESLPLMVDLKASFDELFGDIVDSDELEPDYEHVWDSEHMVFCDKAEWAWSRFERGKDQIQDGEYAVGLESVHEACLVNPGLKKLSGVLFAQGMAHYGLGNARESARCLLEYAKSPLTDQFVDRDDGAFAMVELSKQFESADAALARELVEAAVGLCPTSLECRAEAALAFATMLVGEDEPRAQEVIRSVLDDDEWNDLVQYVKRVKKLRKLLKRMASLIDDD